MSNKIGFVSLGCAKATYDSERLLTKLRTTGYDFALSHGEAELIIINTCGFINDAILESVEAIEHALDNCNKVIVTGCLGTKREFIENRFPDLLGISGPDSDDEVLATLEKHLPIVNNEFSNLTPVNRARLSPKHYAWLKISEGCNQSCSFCVIPAMRGKLKSRNMAEILTEAENLKTSGVKEILIVAQDTAAFGIDKKYRKELINGKMQESKIINLASELGKLGIWIRLHYLYPYPAVDKLVELMADNIILPYLDVPLQHASPEILKAMRRPANIENMQQRIEQWRKVCPDVAIRTTLITGFPGESVDDFDLLHDFVKQVKFDRVGVFTYSKVQGAKANEFSGQVDQEIKELRQDMILNTQEEISQAKLAKRVGNIETVLVDEVLDNNIIARSKYDAPEVDGVVKILTDKTLNQGDFVKVKITGSDYHDLEAKLFADDKSF